MLKLNWIESIDIILLFLLLCGCWSLSNLLWNESICAFGGRRTVRICSLYFQAVCLRKLLNLALIFNVSFVLRQLLVCWCGSSFVVLDLVDFYVVWKGSVEMLMKLTRMVFVAVVWSWILEISIHWWVPGRSDDEIWGSWSTWFIFSARCSIYISRLCYDVSVRLSVCPSVCDGSALAHYS